MKKVKPNIALLTEELKKFRLLSEYSFYTGDDKLDEADEEPEVDPNDEVNKAADSIGDDLGVNDEDPTQDSTTSEPAPAPAPEPAPEPAPAPAPEPAPSDDVEVDVTSLVKGTEKAKSAADHASHNTVALMAKFNDLEDRVAQMGAIANKIDTLEKEIVKRNPTPVEKLEMRSLDSYPYSIKLSDYWSEKEGPYDVMNKDNKEFVLTQDDVDSTYNESSVNSSFNPSDFEEEDINE